MAANSFGVAMRAASSVIHLVCHSISTYLGPKYLHLLRNEIRQNVGEFEQNMECLNVSDVLMEYVPVYIPIYRHIPISSPSENFHEYFCYKQFHSLNVQTVSDLRGLFMDIECRWPECLQTPQYP